MQKDDYRMMFKEASYKACTLSF